MNTTRKLRLERADIATDQRCEIGIHHRRVTSSQHADLRNHFRRKRDVLEPNLTGQLSNLAFELRVSIGM